MILMESAALDRMKTHASFIFPDECCGFLYGEEEDNGNRIISEIREVTNAKEGDKRRRFEITPRDYMQAEQYALTGNLSLLGIYHSHPNHPALPSEQDRMAAQPYFSYVIISVNEGIVGDIHSWRLNETSRFEEEIFSLVQKNQFNSWQQ
jgi:proteasome lid subunit RPN8/RPN11